MGEEKEQAEHKVAERLSAPSGKVVYKSDSERGRRGIAPLFLGVVLVRLGRRFCQRDFQ